MPLVAVYNRQRKLKVSLPDLQQFAEKAVKVCLENKGPYPAILPALGAVEISLVSDRVIARVHDRFMNLPEPTDVITFEHGEILLSVETAGRYASRNDLIFEREVELYILHGLLHLNGFDDKLEADSVLMARVQKDLHKSILLL